MKSPKGISEAKLPLFKISPQVHKYLFKLGIPCYLEGYKYIAYILQNYAEYVSEWKYTYLYVKVGSELNSSGTKVERALRHTIQKSWFNIKDEFLMKQLSIDSSVRNPPKVSHYISAICYDYLSNLEDVCESEG